MKKKILFICGSLNQTTIMFQISRYFEDSECYFTPFYADGIIRLFAEQGLLDFTILGGKFKKDTLNFLASNNLLVDYRGKDNNYDLVFTCTDLIIPKNIRAKKVILVQEGMTDPENLLYYIVKNFKLPRYLASTSMTGLSNQYNYFCVASEGYKKHFIRKGIKEEKLLVTGIPNFDNAKKYLTNRFPYKNYVLVATSDMRETLRYENRKETIINALSIAKEKQLIFKLHPNENFKRAIAEIAEYAPNAIVFTDGNTSEMIANCDVLITKFSSVVYIGLALGKTVYSDFNLEHLKELLPIQNDGLSAYNIAQVGKELISQQVEYKVEITNVFNKFFNRFNKNNSAIGLR